MAAYKGDHYTVTFDDGNNANTKKFDVYAKDDTDAKAKVKIAYSWAQNLVATAAANS
jgi:hypothetical protein